MGRELKRIFISYAHKDANRLAQDLERELRSCSLPNFEVEVWMDGHIRPGEAWHEEIGVKLGQADLVVLLVSGAFGESSYIQEKELPVVLERFRARKSDLMWIAVDADGDKWAEEQQLGALQAAYRRRHLEGCNERDLANALVEIRNEALGLLDPDGRRLHESLNPKYELKRRLGGGRSWQIYLATDRRLRRDVAVYCPADADQREQMEKTVTSATEHAGPAMATIYGAWLDVSPTPHVIAQFASGGTLAKRIAETQQQTGAGLSCEEVRGLVLHLARALAVDTHHNAKLLELRPSKVLIDENAGFLISPFGRWRWSFGRALRAHLAESGTAQEERAYVAPELLFGEPKDRDRTYQYLLGLLAWHAILGKLPRAHDGVDQFPAERPPEFKDSLPSPNESQPRCSPWLADLVVTMTAKEPARRFASLDEVVARLAAAPPEELGLVRESYQRCLKAHEPDAFFGRVYARLREALPPEQWKFSSKLDWREQHGNLAEAVALLLAFYAIDSSQTEPTALSRIARTHGKRGHNIAPESFPVFQRALRDTVIETLKPEPEVAEALRVAWDKVLGRGIEYLSKRAT